MLRLHPDPIGSGMGNGGVENVTSLDDIKPLPTPVKEIPDNAPPPAEVKTEKVPIQEINEPGDPNKTLDPNEFQFELPPTEKAPVETKTEKPAGRDYSMFRPEHAEILKKAPNHVFEFAKTVLPKVYEEANKAKEYEAKLKQVETKALPESYFQHPEAYLLSEDFKEANRDLQLASFEAAHWKRQRAAVLNGAKEYQHLKGYKKNGEPVFESVEIPEDKVAEIQAELGDAVQLASQTQSNVAAQVNQLRNNYAKTIETVVTEMKQAEDKYYPMYKEPNDEQKKIISEVTELIPPHFRNNPLASYVAKAGALNIQLINALKAKDAEIEKLKRGKVNAVIAGPGGGDLEAPGGGDDSGMLDPKVWAE